MKKKIWIIALVCLLILIPMAVYGVDLFSTQNIPKDHPAKEAVEQAEAFMRELNEKSVEELLTEIEEKKLDYNEEAMPYAIALRIKENERDSLFWAGLVLDDKRPAVTRMLAIELLYDNLRVERVSDELNEKVFALIYDNNVEIRIREQLLNFSAPKDSGVLKEIALNAEPNMSFIAIRRLYQTYPGEFQVVLNTILNDSDKQPLERLRGAVLYGGPALRSASLQEQEKFLSICKELFAKVDSQEFRDSIAYALGDMNCWNALRYLLSNDKIDRLVKLRCVYESYPVIEQKLADEKLSEADLQVALESMEVNPIDNCLPYLKKQVERLEKAKTSPELVAQGKRVCELVEKEGIMHVDKHK
ncbi:MAG: hypothetical protein LBD02_00685 [Christensenellaceae bacterium]|nr:hypothetical protein [Christensenellaceae bacterium]